MTVNELLLNPVTLLSAVKTIPPLATFFRDFLFKETQQSQTLQVAIDEIVGNRRLAPFVASSAVAPNVERTAFSSRIYRPPLVKAKKNLQALDALSRLPGELPFTTGGAFDIQQRAMELLGWELQDLSDRISRREEWMLSQLLDTGSISISGDGINETVDYEMPAGHKITLTGNDLFSSANSDPIALFTAWQRLVQKDGKMGPADFAIMGRDVRDAFLAHPKISPNATSVLNTLRVDLGVINPNSLPNGAEFLGTLKGLGGLNLYAYNEYYEDDNGNIQDMMPADKIYIGFSRARNIFAYGAIQDVQSPTSAGNASRLPKGIPSLPRNNTYAMSRYPKTWFTEEPSAQILMMQSAPLPIMVQPNCFVSVKAV
jgi:hypothetical protein